MSMTRMTWGSNPMTLKINPPGKCDREHNKLAVGPAVVDDPHDLGLEPHDSNKINPPGKCGREHNKLAVGPAVVDNPHDLGLEPP